jgi:hypothetical protein
MANVMDNLTPVVWSPATIVVMNERMMPKHICRVIVDEENIPEFEHPEDTFERPTECFESMEECFQHPYDEDDCSADAFEFPKDDFQLLEDGVEHPEDDFKRPGHGNAVQVSGEYGWGFFPTKKEGGAFYVQFVCSHQPFEGMPGPSIIAHLTNVDDAGIPFCNGNDDDDSILFGAIQNILDAKIVEMRHTA